MLNPKYHDLIPLTHPAGQAQAAARAALFPHAATRRPAASRLTSTGPLSQTPALSLERKFDH